jgi:hypothetical protein
MLNRCYGTMMALAFIGALLSQVYIPFPDVNIYFLESALLAAWLVSDALERRAKVLSSLGWAAAALVLAPIVIPRWYANRPLKSNETRKGGVDSNFYTAFGIVTVLYTGVSAACNFLAYGPDRGFELIINSGFAVAGTALVLGLAAKQDKVIERAPAPAVVTRKVEEVEVD